MAHDARRPLAWSAATILATVAIGLVAFLPMLGNTFWRDDFDWVSNGIRASRDPAYLLTPIAMFFRPLVNLTFTLNFLLGRLDPAGYLAFNLAVHLLNAVLVAWLARRLAPKSLWIGPVAGMLFAAAFGSFGEAVIWICGRTDLLLTTCLLAALHSHLSALDHARLRDRMATFGWFVLAILTKETAVVVLPALVLLEWLHPSPRTPPPELGGLGGLGGLAGRDALRRYAPFALLLVPYLVYEWVLQREAPAMSHHVYGPGGHVLPHMAEYLVRMWVPLTPNSMILAVPAPLRGPLDATLRVLMVVVPLAWVALLVAPVPRAAKFAILLMMVSVIPFSLFTLRTSTRYLYTPSVGWVLAVTFMGRELWRVLVGPLVVSGEEARAPGSTFARRIAVLSGLVTLAIAMVAQTVSVHYIIRGRHDLGLRQDPAELRAMTELARSLGY